MPFTGWADAAIVTAPGVVMVDRSPVEAETWVSTVAVATEAPMPTFDTLTPMALVQTSGAAWAFSVTPPLVATVASAAMRAATLLRSLASAHEPVADRLTPPAAAMDSAVTAPLAPASIVRVLKPVTDRLPLPPTEASTTLSLPARARERPAAVAPSCAP